MDSAELFRKTLRDYLHKQGHGAQARLADELGMDRRHLNAFLTGNKPLSERKRSMIAEHLGYSYIDFLILGREMFTEKPENFQEKNKNFAESTITPDRTSIETLEALAYAIDIVEETIASIFVPESIIKFPAKIKARAIINIYQRITKKKAGVSNPYDIDLNSLINGLFPDPSKIDIDWVIKHLTPHPSDIDISRLIIIIENFDSYDDQLFDRLYDRCDEHIRNELYGSPIGAKAVTIAQAYTFPDSFEKLFMIKKNNDIKEEKKNEEFLSKVIDITQYFKRAA